MSSKERIYEKIVFLYGEEHAERIVGKLLLHIGDAPQAVVPPQSLPLSEKDMVLITYGDQIGGSLTSVRYGATRLVHD